MERSNYEKLGELERMIYDYLHSAFMENKYTVELDGCIFEADGYVDATVTFGGYQIRCAINEKRFICWHCDNGLIRLLEGVPHLVKKIVAQTKRMIKENEAEYKKERIKELREEIKRLQQK